MVNLERINNLVRMIDAYIALNKLENDLDERKIDMLIRQVNISEVFFSDDEVEAIKREINWKYQIYTTPGQSIMANYEQDNWYSEVKTDIDARFWTRYKNYLIDVNGFSPNVVSTLGEETLDQKLMNYIGNPENPSFFKRGLIIGDVQSGKTSTYIGFICKAADAGYKVFILLTGTIESLRRQTQERVEEGFIGIDLSTDNKSGPRIGVGLDNKPIYATGMTSRVQDFTGNSDKIAVSLSNKDAVVFVIKKNTTVLKKLKDWLVKINADPVSKKIDLPMLLIDDEADNASINTSADKEEPTKINRLIRELANVFSRSNYVGFTATPFANVFIDPETTEKMESEDLFPEDFIVALPTPSNYIGPNKIFSQDGAFHSQLIYIEDAGREINDGYPFYFKHDKYWEDELPESLTDAIYAFYLANALRDLRGDQNQHRSMLINISRFIMVQKYIKREIEEIHKGAYRSLKYNLSGDFIESMKDPVLRRIYNIWSEQYSKLEFSWDDIVSVIFTSIESIQIKVVNSSRESEKLQYPKKESIRVIAIGGLALSRGLTLEGLIISYFYRNTSTYDVLMQMGRWFGYRKNYEDLFRIWTHEDSAEWYAEISEASEKLKDDMSLMREQGMKPRNFGIRVRNNSEKLNITAYNKMRNSSDEFEYLSYFGGFIETPYLLSDTDSQRSNFNNVHKFIKECLDQGYSFRSESMKGSGEHNLIRGVSKHIVISLIKELKISKFCYSFDVSQISEFLSSCIDPSIDIWDIAFMDGEKIEDSVVDLFGRKIYKVKRNKCIFDHDTGRLSLGRRGKLGGPNDGIAGLSDFKNRSAIDILEEAKSKYRDEYKIKYQEEFTRDKTYPSNTWFKYIEDRNPLLLIYFIDVFAEGQKVQTDEFRKKMNGIPAIGFALGLPNTQNSSYIDSIRYKANRIYNYFDKDQILAEGVEE